MDQKLRNVPVIASVELERDAHGTFRRYRASHPFAALQSGGYVVLRHKDVSRLCNDPRLQATETALPLQGGISKGALFDIFQHGMLTANGAIHERRRSGLSRALANQATDHFRLHVRRAAEALVEARRSEGGLELDSGYAARLPVLALAGMLGIEDRQVASFTHDIYEMNAFFRPQAKAEAVTAAELAARRLRSSLETLMTRDWSGQTDDFLSDYLTHVVADTRLSGIEILIQIVQLIIGGTESVRTAIVAQTANLLSSLGQWEAVCDDPALVPAAVAESLRFEPGIAGVVRVSAEEIEIDGWTLPAGELVILSTMSALRDERIFDRADSFDIFRPDLTSSHLAFGGGAHKCVAEALGRVELEESLRVLTERFRNLKLDSVPVFKGHVFVRSSSECRISW